MPEKILVIVESPAKCKKIQGILGSKYIVKASFGHIRNIDKKKGLSAIDINNNYKPKYTIIHGKRKYVKELQKYKKKCKEVIIAADLDREGEAIGYHLVDILKLDILTTKRIVFNEITKSAIQLAIKNPKVLDQNLINAQKARQILDFMIGFDISPILWKHVRNHSSAGRCQSPALKLLCDKELQLKNFKEYGYFHIEGIFKNINDIQFISKSNSKIENKKKILKILNEFKTAQFTLKHIKHKLSVSKPSAPYITSTIQQDANSKLNLTPKITMSILQKLYESGKITYMRTDSKILSKKATNDIKNFVCKKYGKEYHNLRKYQNKSKNAQEAHECIRPVDISLSELDIELGNIGSKLYNLIWKRTIASQMSEMKTTIYQIIIHNNKNNILFECNLEKTNFLGFGIIYNMNKINTIDHIINKISEGELLYIHNIIAKETFTKPITRYVESSLVKTLEKKGIGRPSTFSSIVDTLFKREYIIKTSKKGEEKTLSIFELNYLKNILEKTETRELYPIKNKIFVTELGFNINTFMCKNFTNIIDYNFTSSMEDKLDEIAKGNLIWYSLVDNIYKSFHPKVLSLKNSDYKTIWTNNKLPIGKTPIDNKNIYVVFQLEDLCVIKWLVSRSSVLLLLLLLPGT